MSTTPYRDRSKCVRQVAPIAPPCFESRVQWLEYLDAAAAYQRLDAAAGPLVLTPGAPPTFNSRFSFCEDCNANYRSAMLKQGRCDPGCLRDPPKPKAGMPKVVALLRCSETA